MKKKTILYLFILFTIFWGFNIYLASKIELSSRSIQKSPDILLTVEADKILKRACFNCHSNKVQKPWYANLPIISLVIANNIRKAREDLNFSNWDSLSDKKKSHILNESLEEIEEAEMPPLEYRIFHEEATIDSKDLYTLKSALNTFPYQDYNLDENSHHDDD